MKARPGPSPRRASGAILFHLLRADFYERVRRSSLFFSLLAIVVLTYLCLPAVDAPAWLYLNLGAARPIYNSAWIGLAVAALMAEFFPLFGFYLVKNTIERDRRTGVGEILATTPISKPLYTLGKWLSNVAVLGAVLLVTLFTSLVLQFVRAEDPAVDVWALVSPFLLLLLPEFAFVAALAVLFESIRWLRGGLGNLVYYGVYGALVLAGNLQGVGSVWPGVYAACAAAQAGCKAGRQIDIGGAPLQHLATFRFEGVTWTAEIVAARLAWLAAAVAVAALAAVFFHRFDPSRVGKAPLAQLKQTIRGFILEPRQEGPASATDSPASRGPSPASLTPLLAAGNTLRARAALGARMWVAELRLALKGLAWPWYVVAAGIIAGAALVPLHVARLVVLPLAMVWPVLVWSSLGVREVRHHTAPIVFALPFPLRRQLLTTWLAGVFVSLVMGSTAIVRLALAGGGPAGLAALIGALFVPSLALALGCWSGTSRLFQAIYLFVWYLAAVQGVPWLDFMGHFPQSVALGIPWIVALVTCGLLAAAALGRRRRVRS